MKKAIIIFFLLVLFPSFVLAKKNTSEKRIFAEEDFADRLYTKKEYYDTGQLKVEWNYKDDKLEGISKWYGKNGTLAREQNYENDKIVSLKIYLFYKNELPAGELNYNYKNDKLEGIATRYDGNGILKWEVNYKNDKKHGMERLYDEFGKILEINTYKNDILINSKKYDTDGRLYLDQDYPEYTIIADSNTSQTFSDTLKTYFVKTGKFTVLERTKMDEILKEQKFQLTGCTTTECAVEIGKILNVNYIVISSLGKIANEYIINIRIVDIESSEVIIADMEKCNLEKEIIDAIENIVERISARISDIQEDNKKIKSIAILNSE